MSNVTGMAWREICPWLILLRTFRLSISLPVLFLGTVGAVLTPLGWRAAELVLSDDDAENLYLITVVDANRQWPDVVSQPERLLASPLDAEYATWRLEQFGNVPAVFMRFVQPFYRLGALTTTPGQFFYHLLGGTWNIAVWALLAGAITRIAAVHLGRHERVGLDEAVRHARRNYGWYFVSPFFPMAGVLVTLLPLALIGLLMRTSLGALLAGVFWPLILIAAFMITVLLVGLLFGWPLMWPTISSDENCDAFEAFSRSYSYTFQRPLQYLCYALVVIAFGALSWLLVDRFANAVVDLAFWSVSWGSGGERLERIIYDQAGGLTGVGSACMEFFNRLVLSIAAGFNYSFFFSSAAGIYLLLRQHVDQTELDEVFVEDEAERLGLPVWTPEPAAEPSTETQRASRDAEEADEQP